MANKPRSPQTPPLVTRQWPMALGHSAPVRSTQRGLPRYWGNSGDILVETRIELPNELPSASPGCDSSRSARSRPWRSCCLALGHSHSPSRVSPKNPSLSRNLKFRTSASRFLQQLPHAQLEGSDPLKFPGLSPGTLQPQHLSSALACAHPLRNKNEPALCLRFY